MSEGLIRVMLLGNLGADPELRHTQGGQSVLSIRVACTERYQDRDKQWKERTEWVQCSVWGKRGEALSKILRKGSQVLIEGSLHTSSYEKQGVKQYRTEVNVRNVLLCGGNRGAPAGDERQQEPEQDGGDTGGGFAGDDIPF